jgi:hypothetical protein
MAIDLSKWGIPYDAYLRGVGGRFPNLFLHFFLILTLNLLIAEFTFRYYHLIGRLTKKVFKHQKNGYVTRKY